MSQQVLIQASQVSKRFSRQIKVSLWHAFEDIAHQLGAKQSRDKLRRDEFWALRDVSFTVYRGESVGVIGDNGAGKSTLIKLLMGRMLPTSGHVETRGTINALTVLGLGFDSVLSGRENILLNAATMGLSRRQTLAAMEAIIDFAELREFADAPVQSYSSGMRARLGYSVAAHVNPDILLLDEVLAVGDVGFRRKCRRHLKNYIENGGTTILVTHDMHAVQTMCTRAIVLDHGKLIFDGATTDAIHAYLDNRIDQEEFAAETPLSPNGVGIHSPTLESEPEPEPTSTLSAQEVLPKVTPDPKEIATPVEVTVESPVEVAPPDPEPVAEVVPIRKIPNLSKRHPLVIRELGIRPPQGSHLRTGSPADFRMVYEAIEPIPEIVWGFTVSTADGLVHIASMFDGLSERFYAAEPGIHELIMRVERLPLLSGRYALKGGIGERATGAPLNDIGWEDSPVIFSVRSDPSPENNIHAAIGDLVCFDFHVVKTSS